MRGYLVRRVARAALALVLVVLITYLLFGVLPHTGAGSPGTYLKAIFVNSYRGRGSVPGLIVARLPATASLVIGALVMWVLVAIPVAIAAAVRRGTRIDRAVAGSMLTLGAAPAFWLGLLGLYLFASNVGQFPILPGAGSYVGLTADAGKWFTSLIMPWLAIALTQGAMASVLLRRELTELSARDYVVAASAKGLPHRKVVWRHAARAAAAPTLKVLGIELGALLGAAILVEAAFKINGVGLLVYQSIRHHDLVIVEGAVVLAGLFMVLVRLALDIIRALVDPRVRAT
ncbi:MAG TPA: ABC transporter permease [Solirubrobacteraceae bacterium]|nr:ABC transporter permease [Solirubrobacteraceae bacterium]